MRQMPSSIDAEQSLLGSLFIYPNSVRIASEEGLRSEEFFLEAHRKIYAAVETLNGEGKPVDAVSVASLLTDQGLLASVGGLEYIIDRNRAVRSLETGYGNGIADSLGAAHVPP